MPPTPLHTTGDVVLIRSIRARVVVWRWLKDLRKANRLSPRAKCYGYSVAYQPGDARPSTVHLAKSCLDLETVAHECQHLLNLWICALQLDPADEEDNEIIADLGGKLIDMAYEEVKKCATN